MTTYKIDWADGRTTTGYESYTAAQDAVFELYDLAEIGHSGDLSDGGDRTLCWPNEASSVDGDGQRAVCSIGIDEGEIIMTSGRIT